MGRSWPYLVLLLLPLFWAGNFIVGRAFSAELGAITMSFYRWLLALCLLAPFAYSRVRQEYHFGRHARSRKFSSRSRFMHFLCSCATFVTFGSLWPDSSSARTTSTSCDDFSALNIADRYLVNMAVKHQRPPCLVKLALISTLISAKLSEELHPSFKRMVIFAQECWNLNIQISDLLQME